MNSVENDKRPLPICENIKVIGLFEDDLGAKMMKEFDSEKIVKWKIMTKYAF